MRAFVTALLPVLTALGGCSEYGIKSEEGGAKPSGDSGNPCPSGHPDCDDSGASDGGSSSASTCDDQNFDGGTLELEDSCYVDKQTGTFTPVVEWKKTTWDVDPSSTNIMMMPAVASLTDDNGDGLINSEDTPDIIVVTYGSFGTLRAVSGDGSAEIFSVSGQELQGQGAVAVGDIDGDGIVEIIACTSTAVKAFEHDGTLKWTSPSVAGNIYGKADAPSIADMNGDGKPEIIVGSAILDNAGNVLGRGRYGMGRSTLAGATSFAVDLDGDGQQEVIVGNAAYDINGTALWNNGEIDGYVAVADFDNDGKGEIVVTGDGKVRMQDHDGTVVCRGEIPGAPDTYGGPPTIADFDGDGEPEFGVAANSTYTVFESDCTELWQAKTQDGSSGNTGSSVFDFEGDGVAEAVYADETRLWVFAGPDGSVRLESTEHSNATWTEYPTIADVDGDGQAEIVVPNTESHVGFYVFGDEDNSWRAGRRIWNQHAYSITNVTDDGGIPANPEANWDSYNNFRSGDLGSGLAGAYPDLTIQFNDVCDDDLALGRLTVWGQIGNRGFANVEADIDVKLAADTPEGRKTLGGVTISQDVASGELQSSFTFEVTGIDTTIDALYLMVDGGNSRDGTTLECVEDNNEDIWTEAVGG
jgi:FG-GAP-like repeat